METTNCVAMILAGGRGERLGALTHHFPKPAVHFGGHQRLIDFTLNNCRNSRISTVGVLTQCLSSELHDYIAGQSNDDCGYEGIYMLPSRKGNLYHGTADAIRKNVSFIDSHKPDYVLILSGDHIYEMDYDKLIAFHIKNRAEVTVASTTVSMTEAQRFGILSTNSDGYILGFEEKPERPKSNLASMGIYVFNWKTLRSYLSMKNDTRKLCNDFGKELIPEMLRMGEALYAYRFDGYWRDVGTLYSLWEANMDRLTNPEVHPAGIDSEINNANEPHFTLSNGAEICNSLISANCNIFGKLANSICSDMVTIGQGSEIVNSVIMPNVYIGNNVRIRNAIVGTRAVILDNSSIGFDSGSDFFIDKKVCSRGISLVSPWLYINGGINVSGDSHIYESRLRAWEVVTSKTRASRQYSTYKSRVHANIIP